MDVREELVELIAQKVCGTWSESCDEWMPHDCGKCYANDCHISEIADHLISNGITVQEWFSVDDRLPEPKENAICLNRHGAMMIGIYTEWGWMFPCYFEEPTYWMKMPQPPKGE